MTAAILLTMLAMLAARGTPLGRTMHRWMVEAPARWASRVTRGHVLLLLLIVAVVSGVAWLLEGDGIRLMAMMAPEAMAWLSMFEVSAWLDAAVVVVASAATVRWSGVAVALKARLRRGGVARARRARAARRERPASSDDSEGRGLLLAA